MIDDEERITSEASSTGTLQEDCSVSKAHTPHVPPKLLYRACPCTSEAGHAPSHRITSLGENVGSYLHSATHGRIPCAQLMFLRMVRGFGIVVVR